MRKIFSFICLIVSVICAFSSNMFEASAETNSDYAYLGGMPAGFTMYINGACVVGLCDVITKEGVASPSRAVGIEVGDVIKCIDDKKVFDANDIEKHIKDKFTVKIEINRNGETIFKDVCPAIDLNGTAKLGIFVKDSVSGIGTITFIKDNKFASLGHAVIDDNKNVLECNGGNIYLCKITGIVKGERGKAGELKGVFLRTNPIAIINKNMLMGVYGELTDNYKTDKLKKIEIGEAKIGDASVYTTIAGDTPKAYSISIVKHDYFGENKNFVIKVTDKELLEKTGGIVQGMSGSPIVQDGKLVGAVTHVFINDPTRGFGISIEKMMNCI